MSFCLRERISIADETGTFRLTAKLSLLCFFFVIYLLVDQLVSSYFYLSFELVSNSNSKEGRTVSFPVWRYNFCCIFVSSVVIYPNAGE